MPFPASVCDVIGAFGLQAYGLTLQQVQRAVAQDNVNSPAGTVLQGPSTFDLRVSSPVTRVEQFNDIVLRSGPAGTVYLKEVARVEDTFEPESSILRLDGRRSVGLSVTQQSDANTVETVQAVKRELARFQRALPPGTTLTVTNDASRFTKRAIDAHPLRQEH
jgi:HAE1 family hydrophobic/amphiphilic exporter-1